MCSRAFPQGHSASTFSVSLLRYYTLTRCTLHLPSKLQEHRPLPQVFPTPKNRIKENSDDNLCNKNQLDALFILNSFSQSTSTCFGHIFSPSSEGIVYIYTTNWYVLFFLVDCLLAGQLRINSTSSWFLLQRYIEIYGQQNTNSDNKYTNKSINYIDISKHISQFFFGVCLFKNI